MLFESLRCISLLIIISFKNVVTVKMNIGKLLITSCSELSNILRVKECSVMVQ